MNLQEALQYRSQCLIHNKPMDSLKYLGSSDHFKDAKLIKRGIEGRIRAAVAPRFARVTFFKDGTLVPEYPILTIKDPLQFILGCQDCKLQLASTPEDGVLFTSLKTIFSKLHYYQFNLMDNGTGTYSVELVFEVVRYYDDNKFYHLSSNLKTGTANFRMGSCEGPAKVDDVIKSMMDLTVPKFDPTKIQSLDQMISKMKTYNLFS